MEKMKIAVIGQGRSGRDIHGAFYKSDANDIFEVAVVVESDPQRRKRALAEYPGCRVAESYQELFGMTDIDLVVNASFSNMHYSITKDLLRHRFHVLVEKPFAANYYECADLIKTARDHGVVLAVFQQSFYAPFYIYAKELAESGKLGDIKQISIRYNSLSRRWDWQTLQCMLAGGVYNTGPHPIGLGLGFLDFSKDARVAFSRLDLAMTSGDADDFAKIILTAPGKPVVDIEISQADAFSDYNLKLQGSKGTFKCTTKNFRMKYIVDGENPDRPVIRKALSDAEGFPAYCSEQLITHEEEGAFDGTAFDVATERFYRKLYRAIKQGEPLEITPEQAARIIGVIETVHAQNPLPVQYS